LEGCYRRFIEGFFYSNSIDMVEIEKRQNETRECEESFQELKRRTIA
jgi:uncharacterized membrane protein (DUF106 family)